MQLMPNGLMEELLQHSWKATVILASQFFSELQRSMHSKPCPCGSSRVPLENPLPVTGFPVYFGEGRKICMFCENMVLNFPFSEVNKHNGLD